MMDVWLLWPVAVFTLLAIIIGAVVLRKNDFSAPSTSVKQSRVVTGKTEDESELRPLEALLPCTDINTDCTQTFISGKDTTSVYTSHTAWGRLREEETTGSKRETPVARNGECANLPSVDGMGDEDKPLRYVPGMLRTSQLEKMMSKEELEEERRVQREQLAAIFKLLKENQETFGEVTENDMEEQLKLYSI